MSYTSPVIYVQLIAQLQLPIFSASYSTAPTTVCDVIRVQKISLSHYDRCGRIKSINNCILMHLYCVFAICYTFNISISFSCKYDLMIDRLVCSWTFVVRYVVFVECIIVIFNSDVLILRKPSNVIVVTYCLRMNVNQS